MKPESTTPSTQFSKCLYRLANECTIMTSGDLSGVAESTAHVILIEVCKAIVLKKYDEFVDLQWKDREYGKTENMEGKQLQLLIVIISNLWRILKCRRMAKRATKHS